MITLTREEAQQVLDALEDAADHIGCPDDDDAIGVARRTLRAQLAQPEPEPVAWTYDKFNWESWGDGSWQITVTQNKEQDDQQPLYTAPPQPEPYRQQADAVFAETNGRMRIDPVTGNVGIGWASEPELKVVSTGVTHIYSTGAPVAQPEPEPEKCIVRDCENHKHQGRFVGDLCSPCHAFITRNEGKYSQAYRNAQREWQGLTDEEVMSLLPGAVRLPPGWVDTVRAIEAKLREKNGGA